MTAPLTYLTKKGALSWTEEALHTFEKMNKFMSSCLVLALFDFTQPFVVECDASGEGIGTVLIQNHHPVTFESRKLSKAFERL